MGQTIETENGDSISISLAGGDYEVELRTTEGDMVALTFTEEEMSDIEAMIRDVTRKGL